MKVVIVEDEKLAADRLCMLLHEYDHSIEVVACLESVEETVNYLKTRPHPDLLLMDIHLSDGHCFGIFKEVAYTRPVIFTTAYDQYALEAFSICSVGYVLKPVTLEALGSAINKFKALASGFLFMDYGKMIQPRSTQLYKKRFLGKVGQRLYFIDTADISFFQADNRIVHMADKQGNSYVVDHTMERLEQLLDPEEFFRLNRKFIVRVNAIEQVKPYFNNRLKISLKGCSLPEADMVISRDRVAEFRAWAEA